MKNMKNILFRFMLLLTFSKISISKNEPEFVFSLEYMEYCKNIKDKGILSLENFNLWPNYTSSGYLDLSEDFPSTATVNFIVYTQVNNSWSESSISTKKQNLCTFIEKDVWFLPVARMVLDIPKRCPIKKTHFTFKSVIFYKKTRGILPVGCFKQYVIVTNKDKMLACTSSVSKLANYAQRFEKFCIKP